MENPDASCQSALAEHYIRPTLSHRQTSYYNQFVCATDAALVTAMLCKITAVQTPDSRTVEQHDRPPATREARVNNQTGGHDPAQIASKLPRPHDDVAMVTVQHVRACYATDGRFAITIFFVITISSSISTSLSALSGTSADAAC